MACCWFGISCKNQATFDSRDDADSLCNSVSWAQYMSKSFYTVILPSVYCHTHAIPIDLNWEESSLFKRYIVSLYWAVTTITSVGYDHFYMFAGVHT